MAIDRMSPRDLVLLAFLTLAWGINWPVMKFGVTAFPPMLFRTAALVGGVAVLGVWIRAQGLSLAVPRRAWPTLAWLAVPNVIVWHVVALYALQMLPSGRASILGYTMPVWAVLIGLAVYREPPPARYGWGVAAALAGTLLLLSTELTTLAGSPTGTLLMLLSAAAWGWGTILMRRHLTEIPTAVLTFWMLAATIPVVGPISLATEIPQWRWPSGWEGAAIAYNVFVATAFCNVVWFRLARILPPSASGLSVMMIPVLGVFSSMAMLGERPHWQDYVALALVLVALATVLFRPRRAPAAS